MIIAKSKSESTMIVNIHFSQPSFVPECIILVKSQLNRHFDSSTV